MARPLFQLEPRLSLCASLVRNGTRLADVGTDHAYLPIWLIRQGVVEQAAAGDIRPGPLEAARRNAEKYGVGDKLSLRLSDGLKGFSPEEAQDVVIAGMGGELILRIVEETSWLKTGDIQLILQPMSSVPELRTGLRDLGFQVTREEAVLEGGRVYSAFSAVYIGVSPEIGPLYPVMGMLKPGSPAVERYAEKVLRELSNQLEGATHLHMADQAETLRGQIQEIRSRYLLGTHG